MSENKIFKINFVNLGKAFLTAFTALYSTFSFATTNFDHSHSLWQSIVSKQVVVDGHESRVKYTKIKSNPAELNVYLKNIESVTKAQFDQFTENQKLAFLINAYNALTIKLIIDNYPVNSINDIGSFLKKPWKIKFFKLFGENSHLDKIEHDMVRKWFNEPRIHFALVCASVGCPAIRNEAFVAEKLEQQLESAAVNFLTNEAKNKYNSAQRTLALSSIFKWYGDDFVKKFGSVEAFVANRITANPAEQKMIRNRQASLSYLDYDWSLNDQK